MNIVENTIYIKIKSILICNMKDNISIVYTKIQMKKHST